MAETLDALALAQLPEDHLVCRLARLFRQYLRGRSFEVMDEGVVLDWVLGTFGELFPAGEELRLGRELLTEVKRQMYLAERRADARPKELSNSVGARRARVADEVLGPATRHMSHKIAAHKPPRYTEIWVRAGLVAGIVPGNELTGKKSVLVFRAPGGRRVQTFWVGSVLEKPNREPHGPYRIERALERLRTPAVSGALALGWRVEPEWHKMRWRIYAPDGRSSTSPWPRP